jgi:hypothetical protein
MDPIDFLEWLGDKLEGLVSSPVVDSRLAMGQGIVQDAFDLFTSMAREDIQSVMNYLVDPSIEIIGNFNLPRDQRDDWDWIEGILATIQGYEE